VRRLPRLLSAVAVAVGLSVAAGACDTSPYAAVVDGHVVRQTSLNVELRYLSDNTRYIAAITNSSSGATVTGAAPGTYSTAWTAHVLTGIVTADAVHRYLAAHHDLPGGAMLTAARTVNAANYQSLWTAFPAAYRATLAERTAELAQLETPSAPASQLASDYERFRNYFFRDVCVRTAAVSAATDAAALAQAESLVARIDASKTGAAHAQAGTVACYTPSQLETQGGKFMALVVGLPTGRAAPPQKTPYGYQVVAVVSRTTIPFAGDLQRALSAVVTSNQPDATLDRVLAHARVKVNPAYGSWGGSQAHGFAVIAPEPPRT
jgi:hypothetical protein